jgi:hypothetical protein
MPEVYSLSSYRLKTSILIYKFVKGGMRVIANQEAGQWVVKIVEK